MHFEDKHEHRVLAKQLVRDICMLYHELSEFNHFMGDLDYDNFYTRRYWEFISNTGLDWQTNAFIQEGCLVMLLAMSWDCIDGSGTYLLPNIEAARSAVRSVTIADKRAARLLRAVATAIEAASTKLPSDDELSSEASWVHDTYVKGYFIRTARELCNHKADGN